MEFPSNWLALVSVNFYKLIHILDPSHSYPSAFTCTVSLNWDQGSISFLSLVHSLWCSLYTISSVMASQNTNDQDDFSPHLYTA